MGVGPLRDAPGAGRQGPAAQIMTAMRYPGEGQRSPDRKFTNYINVLREIGFVLQNLLRPGAGSDADAQAWLRSSRSVCGAGIGPMPSATISRHSRFCGMIGGTGMVVGSGVASAIGFSIARPVTSPRRKKPL